MGLKRIKRTYLTILLTLWSLSFYAQAKQEIVDLLERAGFEDIKHETPYFHVPERDMRISARKP